MDTVTLPVKDLIYYLTLFIGLVSMFLAFRSKLNSLEKDIAQLQRILLGDRGALNVIDQATCRENRDHVFTAIRRLEKTSELFVTKVEEIDKKIDNICLYQEINKDKEDKDT